MMRKGLLQCPILSGLKRLKLIGFEKNYMPMYESGKSFFLVTMKQKKGKHLVKQVAIINGLRYA